MISDDLLHKLRKIAEKATGSCRIEWRPIDALFLLDWIDALRKSPQEIINKEIQANKVACETFRSECQSVVDKKVAEAEIRATKGIKRAEDKYKEANDELKLLADKARLEADAWKAEAAIQKCLTASIEDEWLKFKGKSEAESAVIDAALNWSRWQDGEGELIDIKDVAQQLKDAVKKLEESKTDEPII